MKAVPCCWKCCGPHTKPERLCLPLPRALLLGLLSVLVVAVSSLVVGEVRAPDPSNLLLFGELGSLSGYKALPVARCIEASLALRGDSSMAAEALLARTFGFPRGLGRPPMVPIWPLPELLWLWRAGMWHPMTSLWLSLVSVWSPVETLSLSMLPAWWPRDPTRHEEPPWWLGASGWWLAMAS